MAGDCMEAANEYYKECDAAIARADKAEAQIVQINKMFTIALTEESEIDALIQAVCKENDKQKTRAEALERALQSQQIVLCAICEHEKDWKTNNICAHCTSHDRWQLASRFFAEPENDKKPHGECADCFIEYQEAVFPPPTALPDDLLF